ncbi:phosphinothricin acetyltransferase [Dyadobacter sp. BE34]|uniref:Phosphinothricin acetyltransferase n=1 Tax=Dyadobacter fermentans TaxID=94254 RepID=A0ABU1QWL0_9BACT|nr:MULTISPECIES: N-acetyltransferase family protein [Dyadobacter]MDR6804685.1 phosphinothricin acetyltransferase [Dyadobacter fermentans]MDR7043556.1 phosphinothricin acetyltransferase [Dyadobacter sp. BE242]MDR7197868.1 phosphinothricin acetyltransferase [Dyadobacter sp. BE34]MDR7214699.1 phosphinothricin acetyltransferase [Dyadobacter sp. BE31]MDR7262234.1 phosphinothricin acetyltransferase [Dyadobacter sp. BE32]
MTIRELTPKDWTAVRAIYAQGIATGQATLETSPPEWEVWDQSHVANLRYVAVSDSGEVAGWAALTPVSGRCVYAGVAEVSIYIAEAFRGQKIGDLLLKHLIAESECKEYWTLQASIFPENPASIRLHENNGFRIIGYREKIGKMKGAWRNITLLERRSKTIGVN